MMSNSDGVGRARAARPRVGALAAVWLALVACAATAAAQSTDVRNPTPLASGEITGAGVAEKTSYYYTFDGGPGEVTAALEAKARQGAKKAAIGVELFDASARPIAATLINHGVEGGKERLEQALLGGLGKLTDRLESLGGDAKRQTARVRVKARQPLTLRLTIGEGIESYAVRLGGAVEFGQTAAPDGGAEPTDPAQPDTTAETPAAAEPPATEQTPAADSQADASAPPSGEQVPQGEQGAGEPPAGGQPKAPAVKVPGRKPAVVKIPGKQSQPAAQPGQKPAVVKIPGKKPQP